MKISARVIAAVRPACALLICALLFTTGCRHGGGNPDALVRLINAAPDAEDLSVSVDGQRVWRNAAYRSNTGYSGVKAGAYQVDLKAQQQGQRLTGRNYIPCQKGHAYTVVAFSPGPGLLDAPGLHIFDDPRVSPNIGSKVRIRLINAAGDLGSVDVLFNNIVGLPNVPFGARSGAIFMDPGIYDMKIYSAANSNAWVGPIRMGFQPGRSYTLVVMGHPGTALSPPSLALMAYPDNP